MKFNPLSLPSTIRPLILGISTLIAANHVNAQISFDSAQLPTANEVLPDLVPVSHQAWDWVHGWTVEEVAGTNEVRIRLSTAVANLGRAPMHIVGGDITSGASREVEQVIYYDDGTTQREVAGEFLYHPTHSHVHFDGFATYGLRHVTPGGGVGEIAALGDKVSFCLTDISLVDPQLRQSAPYYFRPPYACGPEQSINPGWADVYGSNLDGQWITVTDVPDGQYWLEVTADPDNLLREADETNNTTRILIDFDNPRGSVPEPSSALLVGTAFLAALFRRSRSRKF